MKASRWGNGSLRNNNKEKIWIIIISMLWIALGLLFGATNNRNGFCVGDAVFRALGLKAWSKGTEGTHYPGIIGMFLIFTGAGMLFSTMSGKKRLLTGIIIVLVYVVLSFSIAIM